MTEQIRVTEHNWKKLNARKDPGDSFNDVITDLLKAQEHRLADAEPKTLPNDNDNE